MNTATSAFLNRPVISFAEAKAARDKRNAAKEAMQRYFDARLAFERDPSLLTADLYLVTYVCHLATIENLDTGERYRLIGEKRKQIDAVLTNQNGAA